MEQKRRPTERSCSLASPRQKGGKGRLADPAGPEISRGSPDARPIRQHFSHKVPRPRRFLRVQKESRQTITVSRPGYADGFESALGEGDLRVTCRSHRLRTAARSYVSLCPLLLLVVEPTKTDAAAHDLLESTDTAYLERRTFLSAVWVARLLEAQ